MVSVQRNGIDKYAKASLDKESRLRGCCCPAVHTHPSPNRNQDRLCEVKLPQESLPSCCRYLVPLSLG